jgi:membrane protease YdiL (CAAX protease family)
VPAIGFAGLETENRFPIAAGLTSNATQTTIYCVYHCPAYRYSFSKIRGGGIGANFADQGGRFGVFVVAAASFFLVAAPIQEEFVFRGLLQTALARGTAETGWGVHYPVIAVALLFGAVHMAVGPVTAVCAAGLGLIAGELRRSSGSLLPAILVHSLFNAAPYWMKLLG